MRVGRAFSEEENEANLALFFFFVNLVYFEEVVKGSKWRIAMNT